MVIVAQLVESRIVIPVVAGSSPVVHPNKSSSYQLLIFTSSALPHKCNQFITAFNKCPRQAVNFYPFQTTRNTCQYPSTINWSHLYNEELISMNLSRVELRRFWRIDVETIRSIYYKSRFHWWWLFPRSRNSYAKKTCCLYDSLFNSYR